jgi:hypothetical protein
LIDGQNEKACQTSSGLAVGRIRIGRPRGA